MHESRWPLRTLFWEATLRCNAFCAFCGIRCGEVLTEDLPAELVKTALRETAEAFDARSIMLNVTGGEPLLRQDLFEVLAYARELDYPWGLVTNGTLITPEVVARMRETGMSLFALANPQDRDLCVYWNSVFVPVDAEVLLPADRSDLFAEM